MWKDTVLFLGSLQDLGSLWSALRLKGASQNVTWSMSSLHDLNQTLKMVFVNQRKGRLI